MNSSYMLERRAREAQIRTHINQKMDEAGVRERLKELLRKRLKECGWRDQLKEQCKEVIREKGLDHVTVETLVTEMTQFARSSVPEGVKRELLQEIRDFVQSQQ